MKECQKRFFKEVIALNELRECPHITQIHESFESDNHLNIVMRYYNGGTVQDLFDAYKRAKRDIPIDIIHKIGM